jgi:hypothetical protein
MYDLYYSGYAGSSTRKDIAEVDIGLSNTSYIEKGFLPGLESKKSKSNSPSYVLISGCLIWYSRPIMQSRVTFRQESHLLLQTSQLLGSTHISPFWHSF